MDVCGDYIKINGIQPSTYQYNPDTVTGPKPVPVYGSSASFQPNPGIRAGLRKSVGVNA